MQYFAASMPPIVLEFHRRNSEAIVDADPCSSSRRSPR
jgi:hypothetical protein